jgi:hypothetical protein
LGDFMLVLAEPRGAALDAKRAFGESVRIAGKLMRPQVTVIDLDDESAVARLAVP